MEDYLLSEQKPELRSKSRLFPLAELYGSTSIMQAFTIWSNLRSVFQLSLNEVISDLFDVYMMAVVYVVRVSLTVVCEMR